MIGTKHWIDSGLARSVSGTALASVMPGGVIGPVYGSAISNSTKVGNQVLDAAKLEDLLSLLDAVYDLPGDNELKRAFMAHKVAKRITR
jgi:hypothetical protein